jgi:hypothetical protein
MPKTLISKAAPHQHFLRPERRIRTMVGENPIVGKVRKMDFDHGMQNTAHPQLISADREATLTFNVVIVYEDVLAGKRAKETSDVLARNLGDEFRFGNQMWRFDMLGIPRMHEQAVADAARADILMVSFGAAKKLPVSLKFWMERWLDEKISAMALVGLFVARGGKSESSQSVRDYLADVARRARLEFFAHTFEGKARASKPAVHLRLKSTVTPQFSVPIFAEGGPRQLGFPRWGINE